MRFQGLYINAPSALQTYLYGVSALNAIAERIAMYIKESVSTDVRLAAVHEGTGNIRIRHFFKGQSRTGVHLHVWELDPGVSEGMHIHEGTDNYEEIYYFFQGEGVMWIAAEKVPVAAGDAVLVPPGVDHGFENTGAVPLKLLLLFGKPLA